MKSAKLKSVVNFRELGGIKLEGGREVKRGMIYRSGHLGEISKKDKETLDSLAIDIVIDYRDERERSLHPDYMGNFEYKATPALINAEDNPIVPKEMEKFLRALTDDICEETIQKFKKGYLDLPFSNEAFKDTFKEMNEGKRMLYHCTAGKDRTGIMSMLILKSLGASNEDIVADYMLSNKYRRRLNRSIMLKVRIGIGTKVAIRAAKEATYCNEQLFRDVLAEIDGKHPDFKEFLATEYQITAEQIEKWKELYTEKSED